MDTDIKLPYQPNNLSYYTTWWLTSVPSISSQQTTLSSLDGDNVAVVVKDRRKQKINENHKKTICCIPMKIFRLKLKTKKLCI